VIGVGTDTSSAATSGTSGDPTATCSVTVRIGYTRDGNESMATVRLGTQP